MFSLTDRECRTVYVINISRCLINSLLWIMIVFISGLSFPPLSSVGNIGANNTCSEPGTRDKVSLYQLDVSSWHCCTTTPPHHHIPHTTPTTTLFSFYSDLVNNGNDLSNTINNWHSSRNIWVIHNCLSITMNLQTVSIIIIWLSNQSSVACELDHQDELRIGLAVEVGGGEPTILYLSVKAQ